jgi:hypothetical protein
LGDPLPERGQDAPALQKTVLKSCHVEKWLVQQTAGGSPENSKGLDKEGFGSRPLKELPLDNFMVNGMIAIVCIFLKSDTFVTSNNDLLSVCNTLLLFHAFEIPTSSKMFCYLQKENAASPVFCWKGKLYPCMKTNTNQARTSGQS